MSSGSQSTKNQLQKTEFRSPIHKPAPAYDELTTQAEIFETGVKVIDLVAPMLK